MARLAKVGHGSARELMHCHPVYESYLSNLGYPGDHQHAAADRTEHFLSGKRIPHEEKARDESQKPGPQ